MSEETPRRVEFFFDVASPYSYLASTRIEEICTRHAAGLVWRPILMAGLMKDLGITPPIQIPAKLTYMSRDLQRWAEHLGVPFNVPKQFPLNSLPVMRGCVEARNHEKAAAFAKAAFHAYWVEGRKIDEPAVLHELAEEADIHPRHLLDHVVDHEVKEQLRRETREAADRGVFGVPTFILGGEELFWGNDRLFFVEKALAGQTTKRVLAG